MPNQDLLARYNRFLLLMDQTEEAIGKRDLASVGTLQRQVAALIEQMDTLVQSAAKDPVARSAMKDLESIMRQALERVRQNQDRLAGWLTDTGAKIAGLQQGAAVVRSYASSVPLGPSFLEHNA